MSRLCQSVGNVCTNARSVIPKYFSNITRLTVTNSEFKFEQVQEQTILDHLRKLDVKKATGLDDIPPRLLRDSAHVIAMPLTRIINMSLDQGVVPEDFKIAKVIPVFKKGKPEDMDNYTIGLSQYYLLSLKFWRE